MTTAFSIYAPSGGVRTLALTRILARYGERLSAHAISLEWLIRLRRKLFVDLAALPVAAQRRSASGEILDRALADGDAVVEALPGAVLPLAANAVTVAVSTTVLAAINPFAAILLAAGTAVIVATEPHASRRQRLLAGDVARSRGAARAQLIAATAAANELVSLGAIDEVRSTVAGWIASAAVKRTAAERFDRRAATAILGVPGDDDTRRRGFCAHDTRNFAAEGHPYSIDDYRHRGSIRRRAPSAAAAERIGRCGNQTRSGRAGKG